MFRFLAFIVILLHTQIALSEKSGGNGVFESVIEETATQILSRNIPQERFQVIATTTAVDGADTKNILIPGLSRDISAIPLSLERIRPLIKSVKIEVLIDEVYTSKTRTRLGEILKKKLKLKAADSVTFSNLSLPALKSNLQEQLANAEKRLQEVSSDKETLKRDIERKDVKIEELQKADTGAKNTPASLGKSSRPEKIDAITKWSPLLLPLVLLLTGLVFSYGFYKSQTDTSRRLSGAVVQIAQSLTKVQDRSERVTIDAGAPSQVALPMNPSGSGSTDALAQRQRLIELQKDLDLSFRGANRSFIIQHIAQTVTQSPTRAVLLMESLGKDNAALIYEALDVDSQAVIVGAMRTMKIDGNKYDTMILMSEELKTMLIVNAMEISNNSRDPELLAAVTRLSEAQVERVSSSLPNEILGRFLYCLTPVALANLIRKTSEPNQRSRIIGLLPDLPQFARRSELDASVLISIRSLDSDGDRETRPFFGYFKELLESSDDLVSEQITAQITDAPLRLYLAENVIKIGMLFRLSPAILEEIVDKLAIKEIAVLMKHSNDIQRETIARCFSGQRRELIAEEFSYIKDQNVRVTAARYEVLRLKLVEQLRQLQRDGLLEESLRGENAPKTAAAA